MFVFEMFGPSLIMRLRCVCLCLFVHVLMRRYFFFSCNESRWEESVSIPPDALPLLSLWF